MSLDYIAHIIALRSQFLALRKLVQLANYNTLVCRTCPWKGLTALLCSQVRNSGDLKP